MHLRRRHVALPVAFNSELLHLVRVNFFMANPEDNLPFTAETALIFSPLVREIDEDLYEIPTVYRDILLRNLYENKKYGPERIGELASLLWQYTKKRSSWMDREGLQRAQQLTAVYHLKPEFARKWLEENKTSPLPEGSEEREWFVAMDLEFQWRDGLVAEIQGKSRKPLLRNTPITVSNEEFKKVFGLDENRRPLKHIQNEYADNGDGTVTDHATGLMWQKSGSEKRLPFEKTDKYIRELNQKRFAGYSDWRLPTIPELMSLVEPEKNPANNLYIDPIFDKKQWWCWSSDGRSSGGRWNVDFDYGYVYWLSDYDLVRSVRAGQ